MSHKTQVKIAKVLWGILCVLIVGVFTINFLASPSDDKQAISKQEKQRQYGTVEMHTLMKDLDANPMRAEKKYENKYYEVRSALVVYIDSDGDNIQVVDPADEDAIIGMVVNPTSKEQKKDFEKISTGQLVDLKGKISHVGDIIGYTLELDSISY